MILLFSLIWCFLVGLVTAVADAKGYSAVAFCVFAIFLCPIAMVVVVAIEDRNAGPMREAKTSPAYFGQMERAENQWETKEKIKPKTTFVRNCYIYAPFRPCDAELSMKGTTLQHKINVKLYEDIKIDSMKVIVKGFNVFERELYNEDRTVAPLEYGDQSFSFQFNCSFAEDFDLQTVRYVEVYIPIYAHGLKTETLPSLRRCAMPIALKELESYKRTYGSDVISPLIEMDTGWVCFCGAVSAEDICPICHRQLAKRNKLVQPSRRVSGLMEKIAPLHDPKEIQQELEVVKGSIDLDKWEQINTLLEQAQKAKRIYGVNLKDRQKEEIRRILQD